MSKYHQKAAEILAASLITDQREDGTSFVRCANDAPEWVKDAIHAAHGDMLPDDTCYSMCQKIATAIDECYSGNEDADIDDERHERVDDMVSVYNTDRVNWLASHLSRASYCDEAREYGLVADDADMFERIGAGMYLEYDHIWQTLADAIAEQAEELESCADDSEEA